MLEGNHALWFKLILFWLRISIFVSIFVIALDGMSCLILELTLRTYLSSTLELCILVVRGYGSFSLYFISLNSGKYYFELLLLNRLDFDWTSTTEITFCFLFLLSWSNRGCWFVLPVSHLLLLVLWSSNQAISNVLVSHKITFKMFKPQSLLQNFNLSIRI